MIDMVLNPVPYTPTAGRGLLRFNAAGQLVIRKSDGSEINVSMGAAYGVVGADIASASTTNLATATGDYVNITGTAQIDALGTVPAGALYTLVFLGAGQITHNATSLILPGGTNLTRAVGDVGIFRSLGSGNWRCVSFLRTPTVTNLPQNLTISGVISPTLFSTQQNDYNPTGLATATVLRLNPSGAQNITGLQGGATGRVIIIMNISSSPLTLKDEDSSSAAANRFAFTGDVLLNQDAACMIQYDSVVTRWRLVGGGGADTNTSTSVDNELVLFNGTSGKSLKRATSTGRPKLTSGVLSVAAIDLTTEVTNDLPFSNLAQGSALSVAGVAGNATADFASIAAASDFQCLRRNGTSLGFGALNLAQAAAVTGTLAVGNGGTGVAAAGANGNILMSNGTVFASVAGSRRIAELHAPNSTDSNTAEVVWSVSIPSGTLSSDGHVLHVHFGGRFNKNANTKTVRVKFAGNTFWDGGAITTGTGGGSDYWMVIGTIVRAFNTTTIGQFHIVVGDSGTTVPLRCQTRTNTDGGSSTFGDWNSSVTFTVEINSSAANGGPGDVEISYGWMATGPNA